MTDDSDRSRVNWTDSRLDDRFAAINDKLRMHEEALRTFADVGIRIAKLDGQLRSVAEDTHECRQGIASLRKSVQDTADALRTQQLAQSEAKFAERQELAKERTSDRRWLVGTLLTVVAIVLTAISVLAATGAFG